MKELRIRAETALRIWTLCGILVAGGVGILPPARAKDNGQSGQGTSPAGEQQSTDSPEREEALTVTDSIVTFPTTNGSNLEGKPYVLPRDFEGRCNLVFVAFLREQQAMVDTWVPAARYLTGAYPELRYYGLPTISRLNSVARWFINNGMRNGIADPAARQATITLYIDKEPFRQALRIESEETIVVLLLDKEGRVRWRGEGPRTDEKTQGLNRAVRKAFNQPNSHG